MKTIKNIFDFEKGDNFKLKSGATFEVVVSIKEKDNFLAVCIECENEDKIGTRVFNFNFNGLNVILNDDYIESATDKNGKEYNIEREEKEETSMERMLRGIEILTNLEENPNNKEYQKKAYEFAKEGTLCLLKDKNISLEDKKEIMENFNDFKESYENLNANDNTNDKEIENFINELEEE